MTVGLLVALWGVGLLGVVWVPILSRRLRAAVMVWSIGGGVLVITAIVASAGGLIAWSTELTGSILVGLLGLTVVNVVVNIVYTLVANQRIRRP